MRRKKEEEKENQIRGEKEKEEKERIKEDKKKEGKKEKEKDYVKNPKKEKIKDNTGFKITINSSEINSSDSSLINKTLDISEKITTTDWLAQRILPELNSNDEELFDGKDYESRVKKYLKLFFECCTYKDLKIEPNHGREIKFVYKMYEKLIELDESTKNENIVGNSINSSKDTEFDFMIKNIGKKTILNFSEIFEGNVIYKSDLSVLDENNNYQIIGEIAKNILHQSSDKIKQINKNVDIILINDILKKNKSIINREEIEKRFNSINFNFKDDKIIMIVTDGSYPKLVKASGIAEKDEESNNNNSIFNREKKDIQNYRKMIKLLENSKIPFIIFFMPNDLRNNLDDFLIESIKITKFKEMKPKLEQDVYKSYYIKSIDEEINNFKNHIIQYILSTYKDLKIILISITSDLYLKMIESINPKNIFVVEFIFLKQIIFKVNNYFYLKEFLDKYKCFEYKPVIIDNEIEMKNYIKKHNTVPENVFRILIH